ncbi:MAG: mannose-1-phosphate guanylyltransferase [Candidatus Aminicenantes bacterium]|nr:MAG: mannose-1-phosphate guanylyltransferase [Candidatus Aminicenantes bacterium]
MDIRAVIMAGGVGTRFWPLSRIKKPKQFLPIISDKTMIEETVFRLLPLIDPSQIYTIANRSQTNTITKLLPQIPEENFLAEPKGKNTAPSLMLATAVIYLQNPEAVVIALPADHLIKDAALFLQKLEAAGRGISTLEDVIITFGIPPSFPSTGYGYIQISPQESTELAGETFFAVEKFKEKPGIEQAKEFLDAGNHFWNSGMFLWQAKTFPLKLEKYSPELFPFWKKMIKALETKQESLLISAFEDIPSISIDFALMERAQPVWMCRGDFGWSDVGAWSSLSDLWAKDDRRNAFRGDGIFLDSANCLVHNPDKITALVGVEDLIIVDTEDALLVCRKDCDQQVKQVVEYLNKKGKKEHL